MYHAKTHQSAERNEGKSNSKNRHLGDQVKHIKKMLQEMQKHKHQSKKTETSQEMVSSSRITPKVATFKIDKITPQTKQSQPYSPTPKLSKMNHLAPPNPQPYQHHAEQQSFDTYDMELGEDRHLDLNHLRNSLMPHRAGELYSVLSESKRSQISKNEDSHFVEFTGKPGKNMIENRKVHASAGNKIFSEIINKHIKPQLLKASEIFEEPESESEIGSGRKKLSKSKDTVRKNPETKNQQENNQQKTYKGEIEIDSVVRMPLPTYKSNIDNGANSSIQKLTHQELQTKVEKAVQKTRNALAILQQAKRIQKKR